MKAKRLILIVIAVCAVSLFASLTSAEEHKVGHLSKLNMTAEEFSEVNNVNVAEGKVMVFVGDEARDIRHVHVFYDSLVALQMALNAGEIDEIYLPEDVAEYVLNMSDGYKISAIVRTSPSSLALGFRRDDDPSLRNRVDEALLAMKLDGTMAILRAKYIDEPGVDDPEPVKFATYDNVDTKIKVAVTGDLPPIDFIAADGTPAGFNTAVLAELGKRLHVNIELVNIDAAARAASLASGRTDVVFWIQYDNGAEKQSDLPEGIALSDAYYSWDEFFTLKKK